MGHRDKPRVPGCRGDSGEGAFCPSSVALAWSGAPCTGTDREERRPAVGPPGGGGLTRVAPHSGTRALSPFAPQGWQLSAHRDTTEGRLGGARTGSGARRPAPAPPPAPSSPPAGSRALRFPRAPAAGVGEVKPSLVPIRSQPLQPQRARLGVCPGPGFREDTSPSKGRPHFSLSRLRSKQRRSRPPRVCLSGSGPATPWAGANPISPWPTSQPY